MDDTPHQPKNPLDISPTLAKGTEAHDIAACWQPMVSDPLATSVQLNVAVGRPHDFFRVVADIAYRRRVEFYKHKPEGAMDETFYLVGPNLIGSIPEARPATLVTCVDRLGNARLWPLTLPRDGEKDNQSWINAREAARLAMGKWVKLTWNGRAHVVREATPGYAPEPNLAALAPFDDLARIAFGAHGVIADETHPVYRELFGYPAHCEQKQEPGDDF
jgi:hypothetical protein